MTQKEKLEAIDSWLITRRRIIAGADHMRIVDNGKYERMEPIGDVKGPQEIFNIRLENLPDDELYSTIEEIKSCGLHAEWPNICSDRVCLAVHGKTPYYTFDGKEAGIMLREDMPNYPKNSIDITIKRVVTQDEFAVWCDFHKDDPNDPHKWIFYADGHMHFVKEGKLVCFVAYVDGKPAAVSALINDKGAGALEYFKTSPEYRKKEILLPFYKHAIKYAFENGMRFVIGYRYMDWDVDTSNGYSLYDELGFPNLYGN